MRNVRLWLASAVMALLAFTGTGVSQPPLPKDGLPRFTGPPGQPGRLSVDDIVDRIMSFDKNKDGKVTKDELPDRMHFLIERGDTNKDGALDRDEIKKLAADLARDGVFRAFDDRGGPGGGFRPGFGGPGGPGGRFPPGVAIERALDDLNLKEKKRDEAEAIVKAHHENVRKLMELARADLLLKMKDILSEEEYKDFKAALDRPPGFGDFAPGRGGRPPGPFGTGELERKLDQLQKDLDGLRREIRR